MAAARRILDLAAISFTTVIGGSPTTGHQYTSPVLVKVISPEAAAAAISSSENNRRGVLPAVNVICTSSQTGLNPFPGIASITEMNGRAFRPIRNLM
jgi:hypothetical protein